MRWRDIDHINPSQAWKDKAAKAATDVKNGTKNLDQCSAIWRELKTELAALSNQKCWYCESRQTRADNAVDHFRPKSLYPWRAFTIENFRFACAFCNSAHFNEKAGKTQGKQHQFPLFRENKRATREEQIHSEDPILLDPCIAADVGLLDFRIDGKPCPHDPKDPIARRRVEESIRIYNLDHPELSEERRLLGLKIERWIRLADRAYQRTNKKRNAEDLQEFEENLTTLAQCVSDQAELSAFARRVLRVHRTKRWVEELLISI